MKTQQWRYFDQSPFLRSQRHQTTVLFGGLTIGHERLVRASLRALGYQAEIIPTPTVADFQTGKEFGNYGQCNPIYFTVGALLNYLKACEGEGLSKSQVVDRYVYITPASPCGPCRLGMYQNEYRLATDNAGFSGFRIIPFEQKPKISGDPEAGLDVNLDFSAALVFSILMGDVVNQVAHRVRPFEVERGTIDVAIATALKHLEEVIAGLHFTGQESEQSGPSASQGSLLAVLRRLEEWLHGRHLRVLLAGLRQVGEWFDEIEVDRTRVKPVIKITGEFWAQTTEGDGNFRMFEFLESEGAELLVEPVAGWLYHLLHGARQDNQDLTRLVDKREQEITLWDRLRGSLNQKKNGALIEMIDRIYAGLYNKMRAALRDMPHPLLDQEQLDDIAHGFYHSRLEGGEGHLEVAKNIYYHVNGLAHMVLSLKPFGCMPSTQSDAVQAAAQGAFGDMIFLPIETSGEGKLHALSRVQRALGEAKQKARREVELALQETGLTLDEERSCQDRWPELGRPSYRLPARAGVTGTTARLVYHAHDRLNR